MAAHDLDSARIDADHPGPASVGFPVVPLAVDDIGGPGDGDLGGVEVDVGPAQVQQLPASGTGVGGQPVVSAQAVLPGHPEKGPQFAGGSQLPGLSCARARPLRVHRAAQDRYAATGAPLDPPLLLMLDEAAHIAPIRDLATLAATGAGQGIVLCTIWQDLAQIETVYAGPRPAS